MQRENMVIDPKVMDIMREYDKYHYRWTQPHRKDDTMNSTELINKLNMTFFTDIDALVDILVDAGKVERVQEPCKKRTILDEEWHVGDPGEYWTMVKNPDKDCVANVKRVEYADAIAALPDCLRALVMVDNHLERNHDYNHNECMSVFMTPAVYTAISDALEKAGLGCSS